MQDVNVPRALTKVKLDGAGFEEMDTTYFLTRETLIATDRPGMSLWRVGEWLAERPGAEHGDAQG